MVCEMEMPRETRKALKMEEKKPEDRRAVCVLAKPKLSQPWLTLPCSL
jgi:hypothetical protein